MKTALSGFAILVAQTCVYAQATLHALDAPGILVPSSLLPLPSSTVSTAETTFIKAIGIGADGFTTYEEILIPLTTSPAPTVTSTSGGGFNLGGLNITSVDTFAEAASAYKTQASWSSAGVEINESLSCNFISQESASCVDIYEIQSASKTETSSTTFTARFDPIFTVSANAPVSTATPSTPTATPSTPTTTPSTPIATPSTTSSTSTVTHSANSNAISTLGVSSALLYLSIMGALLDTLI